MEYTGCLLQTVIIRGDTYSTAMDHWQEYFIDDDVKYVGTKLEHSRRAIEAHSIAP